MQLQPDQRQFELEFVAPLYAGGEAALYQTRLDGADPEWSAPSNRNSVNYANLSPGSYRLLVRAVTPSGRAGEASSVSFEVLPPFWKRWWFSLTAVIVAAMAALGVHRYRLGLAVELERMRVGIATDLHDDIGSGLSQLAILSDLVRRRLDGAVPMAIEPLACIGVISRELVDSMEDIVWSINPARDRLQDLSRRMRQFAGEVLESQGIDFEMNVAEVSLHLGLYPATRRHVYLIFKEAIHNLRHSGCSKCTVSVSVSAGDLVMEIRDNGRGFPSTGAGQGHGLDSMRDRARRLGGKLDTQSSPEGTLVTARVPVHYMFLRTKVGDPTSGLG